MLCVLFIEGFGLWVFSLMGWLFVVCLFGVGVRVFVVQIITVVAWGVCVIMLDLVVLCLFVWWVCCLVGCCYVLFGWFGYMRL